MHSALVVASMLHHKVMVVDGRWIDLGLAGDYEQRFDLDLAACQRVTLEAWRECGWRQRLGESVALVFEDQV